MSLNTFYASVTYWPRTYVGLWKISAIRLVYEPLLAICLLIGWTSAVTLTSALPMYTDAVNHALLGQELQIESQGGRRPAFAFFHHFVGGSSGGAEWERYQALRAYMATAFAPELGLPVQAQMHAVKSDLFQIFPSAGGSYSIGDKPLLRGYAGFIEGIEAQIMIIEGVTPAATISPGEAAEVLIRPELALEAGLQVGESLVLYDPGGPSAQGLRPRTEIPVRIAGLWEANDPTSDFWYLSPSSLRNVLLMPESVYIAALATQVRGAFYDLSWYTHFNGDRVRAQNVPAFLGRVSRAETRITSLLPGTYLELSPVEGLRRYQRSTSAQTILLLVFGIPVLGLILYFITLIAGSSVERQRLEIATLKSRGASSGQILAVYLLQGAFLGLTALLLGPQAGRLLAQLIGGAVVKASSLYYTVVITSTSLWFALVALALALCATLLPAISAARMTIVHAKQDIGRAQWASGRRPFWQRFFVDVQLLAASGYGYYLLKTQGRIAFLELGASGDPLANPILFLAPTLFIFSATLFCIRLFPLLTWLLSWLLAWFNSLSILLALRNLARSSHAYTGLLLLLILTTSLGTFTASMTRTLDENLVARMFYRVGADVVLTEGVGVATLEAQGEDGQPVADAGEQPTIWINLPVDDHRRAPGVEAVTRMGKFSVSTQQGGQLVGGVLLGIDRTGFPGAAYFRQDFAAESLGSLMNALAMEFSGVIVSQSFLEQAHLAVGDTVALRGLIPTSNQAIHFTIVGSVSLFPTVYPQDGPVFIANLDYIFAELGQELPYKVWLGVDDTTSIANLTAALNELGYKVLAVEEANALVSAAQKQPTRVGVFGFLSVGLITTTVLSMLTLATYAVLSYRQRFIQHGILRAIGLAPRQLAMSLGSEQIIITLLAVAAGVQLGLLASHLFIPFLQIGYSETDLAPPFVVAIAWDDVARLVAALLGAMLVTTGAITGLLLRLQTFKAVKLGEALTS